MIVTIKTKNGVYTTAALNVANALAIAGACHIIDNNVDSLTIDGVGEYILFDGKFRKVEP